MTQEQTQDTSAPSGERYFGGTGRRKSAVARVRLYPGSGTIVINGKPMEEVFARVVHRVKVQLPFQATDTEGRFNVQAKIHGGGVSAWADALAHGTARALVAFDENLKRSLRRAGLMTRDPRVKERKKPGLKRARKAPQYTKR